MVSIFAQAPTQASIRTLFGLLTAHCDWFSALTMRATVAIMGHCSRIGPRTAPGKELPVGSGLTRFAVGQRDVQGRGAAACVADAASAGHRSRQPLATPSIAQLEADEQAFSDVGCARAPGPPRIQRGCQAEVDGYLGPVGPTRITRPSTRHGRRPGHTLASEGNFPGATGHWMRSGRTAIVRLGGANRSDNRASHSSAHYFSWKLAVGDAIVLPISNNPLAKPPH